MKSLNDSENTRGLPEYNDPMVLDLCIINLCGFPGENGGGGTDPMAYKICNYEG